MLYKYGVCCTSIDVDAIELQDNIETIHIQIMASAERRKENNKSNPKEQI